MRKILAVIIIVCLAFGIFLLYLDKTNDNSISTQFEDANAVGTIDFDKIYALHEPDEVIGTLNGRNITWDEYFYAYYTYAKDTQQYIDQLKQYYGLDVGWDDVIDEGTGETFASGVASYPERFLSQYAAIEQYASDNGITIEAADEEELANLLKSNIVSLCGEGATEEDFYKQLEELRMPRSFYNRMMQDTVLNDKLNSLYGANGEKLNDKEAIAMLDEAGYLHAGHILLMTMDKTTGEAVDENTAKALKEKAQGFSDALNAIENKEERYAEFTKLAAENTEDSSIEYTFLPGSMVSEFEDAVKSLGEYEVSAPVETNYGYHVIIRLPLDPDAQLFEYQMNGQTVTGRYYCAMQLISEGLLEIYNNLKIEYNPDFVSPKIGRFVNQG